MQEDSSREDIKQPGYEAIDLGDEEGNLIEYEVTGLDEDPEYKFNRDEHEADTARLLAKSLIAILGGLIITHYGVVFAAHFFEMDGAIAAFKDMYNTTLPICSGLAGSAVTYFFTRKRT